MQTTFLNQLVSSLEEAVKKLEESLEDGDASEFNKIKKEVLQIQKNIEEKIK